MRIALGFGLVLAVASALCGQPRAHVGGVVHPAGTTLPGVTRSLGSVVNPAQGGLRVPGTTRNGFHNNGRVVAAYPVYVGGYYGMPYAPAVDPSAEPAGEGYTAPAPSNTTVVMPPQQQPVTPVVINFNYGSGAPSASAPVPVPVPDQSSNRVQTSGSDDNQEPSHYLIAFKDHTIYAATAYWVDGDTLHYFTAGNVHNQASLSLVDRQFTERLNREAGLDVRLPAPSK